ncbi:choice-of-anchor D domain-containing protein [Corallococcus interemptor]|uniref:choice-of-anchor D domain-containing protein n=1 Tax=Corallococcus interemptor TaxID=2316720 RepID=UPI003D07A94A
MRRLPLLTALLLSVLAACAPVEPEAPDAPGPLGEASQPQGVELTKTFTTKVKWDGATTCPACQPAGYACSDNTGNWNGGNQSFWDPLPTGWLATEVFVNITARGYDGGIFTTSLNNEGLGGGNLPDSGWIGCINRCEQRSIRSAYEKLGLPGYQYGNFNVFKVRSEKTNCFSFADITITAIRPLITSSTPTVSFGSVAVGASATQKLTLTNKGIAPLVISAMTVPPPFSLAAGTLPIALRPDATLDVNVTFAPKDARAISGTLTIQSNDPDKARLPISLEGIGGVPKLQPNPASLDFGGVRAGTSKSLPLQLKNVGAVDLTVSAAQAQSPFSVSGLPANTVLKPSDVLNLTVTFKPTPGEVDQPLFILSQGSTTLAEVALHGKGIQPAIFVAATAMEFGVHTESINPVRQTLTVGNEGEEDLILTAFDVEPPFAVEAGLPLTLKPWGQKDLPVAFTPGAGRATKDLILRSNDPNHPAFRVSLTGTGVEVPALQLTGPDGGTALDFGSREVSSVSTPQPLTLKNVGAGTLVVESIQAPSGFGVTPSGRLSLAPGAATQLQVTFEPPHTAQFTQELSISAEGPGGSTQVVPLSGLGVEGKLTATPAALSFSRTEVGKSSQVVQVTLVNTGTDILTLSTLAVAGPFSVVPPKLPKDLPPRDAFTMDVTFKPVEDGLASGALRVFSNAPSSPTVVKLEGEGLQAIARMASDVMEFGGQRVGGLSPPRELTLFNTGSESLNVSAVNVSGPFLISGLNVGTSVPPGGSRAFQVSYKPTEVTAENGVLEVQSNAPRAAQVTLRGTGTTASIEASVTTLTFGSQFLGSAGQRVVELRNTGTSPITITGLDPVDGFSASGLPLPHRLEAGTSHAFSVVFEPLRTGEYTGSIGVRHDASAAPLMIAVQGSGVTQALTVTPGAISFGNQRVEVTSTPVNLELVNTGNVPVTVQVTSSEAVFQVDTRALSEAIPAGGRASVPVSFRPTSAGTVRGEIRVVPSGGGLGPTVVPVEGIGEAVSVKGSGCTVGGAGGAWMLAAWMLVLGRRRNR